MFKENPDSKRVKRRIKSKCPFLRQEIFLEMVWRIYGRSHYFRRVLVAHFMERPQLPTELLLLEYDRVSELLNDPAFWSTADSLTSILLIATNGSILAHAYANPPSTRIMRSDATSYSATYTAYMNTAGTGHENGVTRCVDGQATVITSVTPHVLLAVTGRTSDSATPEKTGSSSSSLSSSHDQIAVKASEVSQGDLDMLLSISDELTSLLRTELSEMRWPEDF